MKQLKHCKWLIALLIIAALVILNIYFYETITFENLKLYHLKLMNWTTTHYFLTSLVFFTSYIVAVAIAFPGALLFTLMGGYLFGPIIGGIYSILCDTIGACLFYILIKITIGKLVFKNKNKFFTSLHAGFKKNAFHYLLTLRLIPVLPFGLVNTIAIAFGTTLPLFFVATFIGVIPSSFIYASLGHGLDRMFQLNQVPNYTVLFEPYIFLPLMLLLALSLSPIIYNRFFKKNTNAI